MLGSGFCLFELPLSGPDLGSSDSDGFLTKGLACPEGSRTAEMAFLAFQTRLVVRTLPSTALAHDRQGTGKDDSATQNQRSENGCHNHNLKCPVCKQGDVVPMGGKQQQKDKKHYL